MPDFVVIDEEQKEEIYDEIYKELQKEAEPTPETPYINPFQIKSTDDKQVKHIKLLMQELIRTENSERGDTDVQVSI